MGYCAIVAGIALVMGKKSFMDTFGTVDKLNGPFNLCDKLSNERRWLGCLDAYFFLLSSDSDCRLCLRRVMILIRRRLLGAWLGCPQKSVFLCDTILFISSRVVAVLPVYITFHSELRASHFHHTTAYCDARLTRLQDPPNSSGMGLLMHFEY